MTKRFTNTENFAALQTWLLNGAQHAAFNLNVSVVPRSSQSFGHYYEDAAETAQHAGSYSVVGEGECGSVCCIAGAAWQMHEGLFGTKAETGAGTSFEDMENATWAYLGAVEGVAEDYSAGGIFPIFDPDAWDHLSRPTSASVTGPMAARAMDLYNDGNTAAQAIWRALAEANIEVEEAYEAEALEDFMNEYVITDHEDYKERTRFDIL